MTVYLSHRAIAATVKKDDAPYNGAGVSCVDEPIMTTKDVVRAELPPVFFKNDFGVVTNRRQFKEFYSYELAFADLQAVNVAGRTTSSELRRRPDNPAIPAGDHDGLAVVTPLTGIRSEIE